MLVVLFVLPVVFPHMTGLIEYYDLNSKMERLDARSLEDAGSLSTSLRHRGLAGRFFLFFYCAVLPIPPHVFVNPGVLHYYLLGAGHVLWYFVLPVSVVEIVRVIRRKLYPAFSRSFLALAVVNIFIVSMTYLGSERLKIYIYPVMFLFFVHYLANHSRRQKTRTFAILFSLYTLAVVAYALVRT
jgi:hypothetical protein